MAYITNSAQLAFHQSGRNGAAAAVTVTHGSVILRYGQADELMLWTGPLVTQRSLQPGDAIQVPAGAFDFNVPAGTQGVNDNALKAAFDALYAARSSSATALLGTAAMGATGKANEVQDANYQRQAVTLTIATGSAPV